MNQISVIVSVVILIFLSGSFQLSADDNIPLHLLPAETNVITVIKLKELLSSKVSQQEGWQKQLEERFQNGITAIPPNVETYIVGSKVQPFIPQTSWSIGLTKYPDQTTLNDLAQHEGATLEQLAGQQAFFTTHGEYMVGMPGDFIAKVIPGERQEVARYVRQSATQKLPMISSYLQSAALNSPHISITLDMQDMINPAIVRKYLQEDERFSSHRQLVERLVKLLATIKGIKVHYTIDETINTEVHLEFADDVGTLAFALRAILLGLLEDMGAYIDELEKADVKTLGSTVVLKTKMSDESFRFMLSFVLPARSTTGESHFQPRMKPEVVKKPKPELSPEESTAKYLQSINKIIDDLERASNKAKTTSKVYAWYDNAAQKIRSLEKSKVQDVALKYAENVAYELQLIASSLRGDIVEVNTLEGAIVYNYQYNPGYVNYHPWGWNFGYQQGSYNVTSNLEQIREKQATAVNQGAREREQIWTNIRAEQAQIARMATTPQK